MLRRLVVSLVALCLVVSIVPVGGAVAEPATASATGVPAAGAGIDLLADRLRVGTASSGPSRADTDGVLEQPTRAAVYAAVGDAPGATIDELADDVDVTGSTVRYHVDVLRAAGLVETAEISGVTRVSTAEIDAETAGFLRADATGAVLDAVEGNEPASVSTLAEATDRALSTVSHHLSTLESRGLVDRERAGEAVVTTLTPETRAAMAVLGERARSAEA